MEQIFLFSKTLRLSVGPTVYLIDYVMEMRRATDEANRSAADGIMKKWRYNFTTAAHIWIYGVYTDSFILTFPLVFKDANEVTNPS